MKCNSENSDTRKAMVFSNGTCGAMDNASDYGSEDSRFESWQVRLILEANVSFHGNMSVEGPGFESHLG